MEPDTVGVSPLPLVRSAGASSEDNTGKNMAHLNTQSICTAE
jgi:hypothetical protein